MVTWFACSDIHSFYDEWMSALTNSGFDIDNPDHKIIVCGDLFDRGPDTIKCYEFADTMLKQSRMVYVRGNHEDLLQELLHDIKIGKDIMYHHKANHTLDTLCAFMNKSSFEIECGVYTQREFDSTYNKINEFIDTRCVEYFELGDFVFVHSWLPTIGENKNKKLDPNWRSDYANWYRARWGCPFDQWKEGILPDDKTIVVGHWHTSYAHAKLHNVGSERGKDAEFGVFIDDGIIGLDACTAHTHMVNIIKFKQTDDQVILVAGG